MEEGDLRLMGGAIFKLGKAVSEFISTLSAGGGKGPIVQGSREGEGDGRQWHNGEDYVAAGRGEESGGGGVFVTAGLLNSGVEPGWSLDRGFSTLIKPPVGELRSLASGGRLILGRGLRVGFPPPGFPRDCRVCSQAPSIPATPRGAAGLSSQPLH